MAYGPVFDEDFRGAIKFDSLWDAETFRDAINACFDEDIEVAKISFELIAKKKQTIEPLEIEE